MWPSKGKDSEETNVRLIQNAHEVHYYMKWGSYGEVHMNKDEIKDVRFGKHISILNRAVEPKFKKGKETFRRELRKA